MEFIFWSLGIVRGVTSDRGVEYAASDRGVEYADFDLVIPSRIDGLPGLTNTDGLWESVMLPLDTIDGLSFCVLAPEKLVSLNDNVLALLESAIPVTVSMLKNRAGSRIPLHSISVRFGPFRYSVFL